MGEIRISIPIENLGFPYPVCKKNYSSIESHDKQKLRELLYVLDRFAISDTTDYELTALDEDMPRKYLIVQERTGINQLFRNERASGITPGILSAFRTK